MFHTALGLKCSYSDSRELLPGADTLAVIAFGDDVGALSLVDGVPFVSIPTFGPGSDRFYESWATGQRRGSGTHDGLVFAHDDDYLFCAGNIPESGNYTERTHRAYRAAFELADELGFPDLFRMWNYISGINASNDEGLEIYRDFCRGRAHAFEEFDKPVPAATGIGASGGGISFYLLSCRRGSPVHIENPRQVPAYHYPSQYGPRTPKFARATIMSTPSSRGSLYVAGTASILGHETVHAGSIEDQIEVALANIAHLIGKPNLQRYGFDYGLELADVRNAKIYVRHFEHLETVRTRLSDVFSSHTEVRFLTVDICRDDLLVEIEAIA